jgi:hypothetical protein
MCASFLVASRSITSTCLSKLWPEFHKCINDDEPPHASPSKGVRKNGRVLPSRSSKLGVKRDGRDVLPLRLPGSVQKGTNKTKNQQAIEILDRGC